MKRPVNVKGHKRTLPTGKVVNVKPHTRRVKYTSKKGMDVDDYQVFIKITNLGEYKYGVPIDEIWGYDNEMDDISRGEYVDQYYLLPILEERFERKPGEQDWQFDIRIQQENEDIFWELREIAYKQFYDDMMNEEVPFYSNNNLKVNYKDLIGTYFGDLEGESISYYDKGSYQVILDDSELRNVQLGVSIFDSGFDDIKRMELLTSRDGSKVFVPRDEWEKIIKEYDVYQQYYGVKY